jgi:hypothetical protein
MKEFNKLIEAMNELGEDLVKELVKELISSDKKASGDLIKSIHYKVIEGTNQFMLHIIDNGTLKYVDAGRKPGKMPPTSAILPWIKQRKIKPRDKKTGRFITDKAGAFLIARSIGENGIKPTNVIRKSLDKIYSNRKALLQRATIEDINIIIDKINK